MHKHIYQFINDIIEPMNPTVVLQHIMCGESSEPGQRILYFCRLLSSPSMWSSSQRVAHESQSHHGASDVWPTGRGHK